MTGLFVNNLTVIDFSYADYKRGIVGESYIVDIELFGELDPQGMIFDFGSVKKQMKAEIEKLCDHKLWLPLAMEGLVVDLTGDACKARWHTESGDCFDYKSPLCAAFTFDQAHVDQAFIEKKLSAHLLNICPDNIEHVNVAIRTEAIEDDYYHYSHGLKKHLGDCQRIAHGHRSRIQIFQNNQRNKAAEQSWCQRFKDSYLATEEDLVDQTEQNFRFAYHAQQGYFEISVPKRIVTMMTKETTVENIAEFIAAETAKDLTGQIRVKAFEGVEKGALFTIDN